MEPFITIFGREIPIYGIFYFMGIFVASSFGILLAKKKIPSYEVVYSAVYTVLGGVAGAKLLFVLVSFQKIISYKISFLAVLKGGFVFYGGLIGGVLGLLLYCKQYRLPFFLLSDLYAAVLPLGHALGRIGCYFAGCCYGMPYDGPFSVVYFETLGDTPLGISLFPIQLAEAGALMLLFVILSALYRKTSQKKQGLVSGVYGVSYAFLRFGLEYFRGDGVRGSLLGFSTSQWISFLLLAVGVFILISVKKTKNT